MLGIGSLKLTSVDFSISLDAVMVDTWCRETRAIWQDRGLELLISLHSSAEYPCQKMFSGTYYFPPEIEAPLSSARSTRSYIQ